MKIVFGRPVGHWSEESPDSWEINFDIANNKATFPNGFVTPISCLVKNVGYVLLDKEAFDSNMEKVKPLSFLSSNDKRIPRRYREYVLFEFGDYSEFTRSPRLMVEAMRFHVDLWKGYVGFASDYCTTIDDLATAMHRVICVNEDRKGHGNRPLPVWFGSQQHLKEMAKSGKLFQFD